MQMDYQKLGAKLADPRVDCHGNLDLKAGGSQTRSQLEVESASCRSRAEGKQAKILHQPSWYFKAVVFSRQYANRML